MTRVGVSTSIAALALALFAPPAGAQTTSQPADFRHATTLSVSGGGAVDGVTTNAAFGGALGWQLTRGVALEGMGRWMGRGAGSDGFASALVVHASVLPSSHARPFLTAGVGLYHVSFDDSASRMPSFYRRRMANGANSPAAMMSFTDPSLLFGGGLTLPLTQRLSGRWTVDAMMVPLRSRYYVVTTMAVALAYRFEQHPVTPARRSR